MDNNPINKTDIEGLTGENVTVGKKEYKQKKLTAKESKGLNLFHDKFTKTDDTKKVRVHDDGKGNTYAISGYEGGVPIYSKLEPVSPSEQITEQKTATITTPDNQTSSGMPAEHASQSKSTQSNQGSSEKLVKKSAGTSGASAGKTKKEQTAVAASTTGTTTKPTANTGQNARASSTKQNTSTNNQLEHTNKMLAGMAIVAATKETIFTMAKATADASNMDMVDNLIKGAKLAGKIVGVMGVYDAGAKAWDNPSLGNMLKVGYSVSLLSNKINPAVGIVTGILDVTGVTDKVFQGVTNILR